MTETSPVYLKDGVLTSLVNGTESAIDTGAGGGNFTQGGTGANTLTIENKLRQSINSADFVTLNNAFAAAGTGEHIHVDNNTRITLKPAHTVSGVTKFEDLTWPENAVVHYQGPTREEVTHLNNISAPEQIVPTVSTAWAANTAVALGVFRKVTGSPNRCYKCIKAGTTGSSAPTGTTFGATINDGSAQWNYVTDGYYGGVPVNEKRISAPYHPALIIDNKTKASYNNVSQNAHTAAENIEKAGGVDTSAYKSFLFSQVGVDHHQLVSNGKNRDFAWHHFKPSDGSGAYWRLYMKPETGDFGIHRRDSSYPMDIAGAARIIVDTSTGTPNQSDNSGRFSSPTLRLEQKNDTVTNFATISLVGTNGQSIEIRAPEVSSQYSDVYFYAKSGGGAFHGIQARGFYGSVEPNVDNQTSLGRSGQRWSTVYAATGTINTSDERLKTDVTSIDDKVLDAWAEIEFKQYRWIESEKQSGIHFGLIAQDIVAAFARHGLNALDYGVVTHEAWEADETGSGVSEAGDRYGVRYEQANLLTTALLMRKLRDIK